MKSTTRTDIGLPFLEKILLNFRRSKIRNLLQNPKNKVNMNARVDYV
jgi:hypothetical protein